jgi:hypothetical protein
MLWRLAQLLRWAALNNESKLLETPKRPVDNAKLFWKECHKSERLGVPLRLVKCISFCCVAYSGGFKLEHNDDLIQ